MTINAFSVEKPLSQLPPTLTPGRMYAVRVGLGFDLYIADETGAVAHKLNDAVPKLAEYIDSDKPNAQVGEQWIRRNSIKQAQVIAMFGAMPITSIVPTVQIRTQTSTGVI